MRTCTGELNGLFPVHLFRKNPCDGMFLPIMQGFYQLCTCLSRFSVEQPEAFWSGLARSRLTWSNDFHTGMDCSMETGQFSWFEGGKLNVSVNCVDR